VRASGQGRSRASQRAAVSVAGATRQSLTIHIRRVTSAVENAFDQLERHARGLTLGKAPIKLPIRNRSSRGASRQVGLGVSPRCRFGPLGRSEDSRAGAQRLSEVRSTQETRRAASARGGLSRVLRACEAGHDTQAPNRTRQTSPRPRLTGVAPHYTIEPRKYRKDIVADARGRRLSNLHSFERPRVGRRGAGAPWLAPSPTLGAIGGPGEANVGGCGHGPRGAGLGGRRAWRGQHGSKVGSSLWPGPVRLRGDHDPVRWDRACRERRQLV
jgi:hypothetical protein